MPNGILIAFCTVLVAADEPKKPSFDTHPAVAKAYYAQVQEAAGKAPQKEGSTSISTPPKPKKAIGMVVDRQGRAIPGARVMIERESTNDVLGNGTTSATGQFQITLSTQSYKGLSLTITKEGFTRWAMGGLYGGIVDYRIRLDREVTDAFLKSLIDEKDKERRLWMLLDLVGDRQFAKEIRDLFPHLGMLRNDLLDLVRSKVFGTKDGRHSSPAERACFFLAYWYDPADEPLFKGWLKDQRHVEYPKKTLAGKTITEVCQQWADHHFVGKKPEDRTFHTFGKPSLDPTGNHALVEFWVEYKHWGYTQLLVLTKQQGKWQLRFVAEHNHWTKGPTADSK